MIGAPNHFAHEHKSAATYLDVAANDHGDEKGLPVHRALRRNESTEPHIAEIGPGGGAAVDHLATQVAEEPRPVQLTLVEAPGVSSTSLTDAIGRFNAVGSCVLVHGWAQDIGRLLREPVDVISASALMHEVYSYGGAYSGPHTLMRTLPTVLHPYGYFVYRDVYAVAAPARASRAVLQFTSLVAVLAHVRPALPAARHPFLSGHDDTTISIGILDGVGFFVETEILTTNSEDAATQLEVIEQAIGVSTYPIVRLPYRDLVVRAHAT